MSTARRAPAAARPEAIRLRGVRQNNLKGFDVDIPLGRFTVVTGLSGTGKSSLVFETLHAEGQRRYVETFSAYTRQFLDLLDKPRVDSIENIRPSIAIDQANTVKTSRSTVGTMTELTDFAKVWFSHVAECFDPATGEKVEDDNPATIWAKAFAAHAGRNVLVAFKVARPDNLAWPEIFTNLKGQGYARFLVPDPAPGPGAEAGAPARLTLRRLDEALAAEAAPAAFIYVVQDRVALEAANRLRFLEAVETALHFGRGEVRLFAEPAFELIGHYSRGLHSPRTGRTFRAASPALFSFNSPLGACPRCRGFGRIIEIDYRLAIPDANLSIDAGAIKCWEGEIYSESKRDLLVFARRQKIPTNVPFASLSREQQDYVLNGEAGYGEENGKTWPKHWYGIKGFFRYLETKTYKMHVRVFLSRYRSYNLCPDCQGSRLQPEALCWRWQGRTLPELYQLPVGELLAVLASESLPARPGQGQPAHRPAELAHESMLTRLRYLREVGLEYLTLDRQSRTLSGGEVERVNLTSCLGTALVDTLFVLDEPSVGLHPRDISRLIAIIRSLTDAGNTVVLVEHDEAMIGAADHVIELGPEPGARGGHVVFEGTIAAMRRAPASITGAYLSGRERIPVPPVRRPVAGAAWLEFAGVSKHNLRNLDFRLPLQRLVCLSGVSGSGKSTLLDNVIHQGLLAQRNRRTEDPAAIAALKGDGAFGEIVLADQSPLSRTPRSNPAIYSGAWELVRELFAATPAAEAAGFSASSFSFNSGDGRCDHCNGLGFDRVEMQFLSDVFVPCPVCEGARFKPEVLAVTWNGCSVAGLLGMPVMEAMPLFAGEPEIARRLQPLLEVGLGYLNLGQPINTLSGGESQRLKLVRYLGAATEAADGAPEGGRGALLLLDEPTTGLHRHDVRRLLTVLQALVDRGHSVVVIEHHLDVLKSADWILEIGPEAGAGGGRVVAEGPPEVIAAADTATSPFLRAELAGGSRAEPRAAAPLRALAKPELVLVGARENNLKNISLTIPHHAFNVVTGVSGSGKSTLAFDIVFAEGQRRFMESMSPYARQFVEQLPRPDIDRLTGIPPTVAIEQRVTRGSRKSTVATITEVAQYLRLLYARLGVQHHPDTGRAVVPQSTGALKKFLARVLAGPKARRARHLYFCAPLVRGRKGHHQPIATWIGRQGYTLLRADGRLTRVDAFQKLDRYKEHDVEAVTADLKAPGAPAAGAALEEALRVGKGSCFLLLPNGEILSWFSTTRTDIATGESFPELEPKHFSFNSPRGWCPTCRGYGRLFEWLVRDDEDEEQPPEIADLAADQKSTRGEARGREAAAKKDEAPPQAAPVCPDCRGDRLNRIARSVRLQFQGRRPALSLPELVRLPPAELLAALRALQLDARGRLVTQDIVPQIEERLKFLGRVGLSYLALERPTDTLSGGEAQRIRLAAQLGSNLSGVLYVLDEPSIGLHARDNDKLIGTLKALRKKGNTLLVVEHDDEVMAHADRIIDLGPAAGVHGGELLANATPAEIRQVPGSLTGLFLKRGIPHPQRGSYRPLPQAQDSSAWIELNGVSFRNLQGFNLRLPAGRLIMLAGPSGAGKSTLIRDLLGAAVACAVRGDKRKLSGAAFVRQTGFEGDQLAAGAPPPPFAELRLPADFRSVIEVDQAPIGKTPRSTPATYLGIFDLIRQFFASLPEAKMRGYQAGRFSFNTAGGRCPTCEGAGRIRLEMAFMPDTYLPCDDCGGTRYGPELSDITWKGKNIGQVLQLTFAEAAGFFDFHSQLGAVCQLMNDCGLGYLTLGQSSPTLSGGEAQRLKLVTELAGGLATYRERSRGLTPRNLYLLEEPTIGLHLSDCEKLIKVLQSLVDQGHTVVVIEHHLDLLAEADYVAELGPGGGPEGGELLYQGALAGLLRVKRSPTAPYLRKKLRAARARAVSA